MTMLQAFIIPVEDMKTAPTGHLAVMPFDRTHPTQGRLGRALSKAVQPLDNGQVALSHPHVAFRALGTTQVLAFPQKDARIAEILQALADQGVVVMVEISESAVGLPVGPRTYDISGSHHPKMFQDDDHGGMVAVSLDQPALEIMLELEKAGLATIVRRNFGSRDRWCLKGQRGTYFGFELGAPLCVTGDSWRFHDIMVRKAVPKRAQIFDPHLRMYPKCQAFR